jgi:PTH1 family peptidyl-tRNA hydrolase
VTIFGLGNPTERYDRTRHNIGFMVADVLARRLNARFRHLPGRHVAKGQYRDRRLLVVKPLLYMNDSGVAVREQLAERPDDFLVVLDDLALPWGRLRLRPGGSDGGHKGLGSVIYQLGRADFPRVRVGVGPPPPDVDATDYVLERFLPAEAEALPDLLERAADACLDVAADGIEVAMNRFNAPTAEPEEP